MRIAQISTLAAPVRQNSHGSVESLVWLMTREMVRLGHEVTVFGAGGSVADGQFVATLPGAYGDSGSLDDWYLCEWLNLCRAVERSGEFDVLHSHAYLWGLPLQKLARAPMVHTIHIVPDDNHAQLWSLNGPACVTAISRQQWSAYPQLTPAAIVPHGVDLADFQFSAAPGDYVCYLGRFTSGKGPRQAIAVARELGVKLILAGPSSPYFREHVEPLVDGKLIEYIGPVDAAGRNRLLGGARAMLYPIQYPEAFGLVLVEAMLCGTPVAALRLGAVPEIVEDGVTGYSVETLPELAGAVTRCLALDRHLVRAAAGQKFSAARMAQDYLRVYEEIAARR